MFEFPINKFITLKLEDGKTNIYINTKLFRQCKSLFFNISTDNMSSFNDINSIDEIKEINNRFKKKQTIEISPETEFWGHCSNIQAWVENGYNTDLIDSELAFPLLEDLAKLGISKAKNILKSEIIKKIEIGYIPSIYYLLVERFILRTFTKEEVSVLMDTIYDILSHSLEEFYQKDCLTQEDYTFKTLIFLIEFYGDSKAEKIFKEAIKKMFKKGHHKSIQVLINDDYLYEYFNKNELLHLLLLKDSPFTRSLLDFFENNPDYRSLFIKDLKNYERYEKKRKELTGDSGGFARSFLIDVLSLVLKSNFDNMKIKLKETYRTHH